MGSRSASDARGVAQDQLSEELQMYVSNQTEISPLKVSRLFNTSNFSDLIIECAGERWKAHRNILCSRSAFFANACKEDTFEEGGSKNITLKDEDPTIVKEMLKACYACDYDDSVKGHEHRMSFNAMMYFTADKFVMPFLKDLAKSKLDLQLSELDAAKDDTGDIPPFLEVITTIYDHSLDQIFQKVLFNVLRRLRYVLHRDEGFTALLRSGLADGDFAVDAFAALMELSPLRFYSNDCHHVKDQGAYCDWCE